jgi:cystathionine beta-lyase/cystathionine gamma-synthase
MTHADVPEEIKEKIGINQGLIRLSVGIENASDIINDLKQAL